MRLIRLLLIAAALASMGTLAFGYYHYRSMTDWLGTPGGAGDLETVVAVPQGTTVRGALRLLAKAGVVENSPYIRLVGRVGPKPPGVQTGEYAVSDGRSPMELLQMMAEGKVLLYRFTVPPGKTLQQIALHLAAEGLGEAATYLALMKDDAFAQSFGLPGFEGFLFPDTYAIPRGYTEREIVALMVKTFFKIYGGDLQARAKGFGLTMLDVATMASIIEKEAGNQSEYPLVASVIHNRLKRGMRLQMDPTVIYGLGEAFNGNLTRRDLERDHPWNTYTRAGLPPSPICSASGPAVRAALFPADTNYLYFVAMNNGRHKFSATLREHNRAVHKYQIQGHVGP